MKKPTKPHNVIEDKQQEKKTYLALEALALSEGGKILTESLARDIISTIEALGVKYATLSHIELISLCAKLKNQIDLFRSIKRSTKNKEFITEEIEELLLEQIEE